MTRNVFGADVAGKAPPGLREQVAMRRFAKNAGPFTLLSFRTQRNDKVLSATVAAVLDEVSPEENLIAFGGCFTLEAISLLKNANAEIFSVSEFPWTDDRHLEIHTIIGAAVKRPSNEPKP